MNALYTTEALSTGHGREGRVSASDGSSEVTLAPQRELGGSSEGTNPEQLFASGFAACFHSALQAARGKKPRSRTRLSAAGCRSATKTRAVSNSPANWKSPSRTCHMSRPKSTPTPLIWCPYSNVTRGNIDVTVQVSND